MGRGRVVLTFDALRDMLDIPDDAEIYGIEVAVGDLAKSQFSIYVKHSDLPEWYEGAELMRVVPDIETHHAPGAVISKVFKGWR